MAIEVDGIAAIMRETLPEFTTIVDEHVHEWGEEPMHYVLAGNVFQALCNLPDGERRRTILQRAYTLVDRMLIEGSESVQDCFAIEFIEPLTADPSEDQYPGFEATLGPAGRRELAAMRAWWREYHAMRAVIRRLNATLDTPVFGSVGIGPEGIRAIVDPQTWNALANNVRERLLQEFCHEWMRVSPKAHVEIIGPRETNFEALESISLERQ